MCTLANGGLLADGYEDEPTLKALSWSGDVPEDYFGRAVKNLSGYFLWHATQSALPLLSTESMEFSAVSWPAAS
jgi:hypothetical protein